MKLQARAKIQRSQQIEAITSQIANLVNQNKQAPSHKLAKKLSGQRQKLCSLLLYINT